MSHLIKDGVVPKTKNYTFDQFYKGLSNTTIPREQGSKFEYSTFGAVLLGNILTLKLKYYLYVYKMLEEDRLLRLLQRVCPQQLAALSSNSAPPIRVPNAS